MATADNQHRFAELDALRGIAALMVVIYHYTTKYQQLYGHTGSTLIDLRAGRNGVQLFFAISGFVIFMTLERTKKPLDFIVSRFSRLYPAYWAALLLTTAVVLAAGFDSLQVDPASFVANLTMFEGFLPEPHFVDGVSPPARTAHADMNCHLHDLGSTHRRSSRSGSSAGENRYC